MKKGTANPLCLVAALTVLWGAGAQTPAAPPPETSGWLLAGQVEQGYNSNVKSAVDHREADTTTAVTLQLGRNWITPHARFTLVYVPQGMNFARHTSLDYIAHSVRQSWDYTATRHTTLNWNSRFQQFPERGGQAQMGAPSLAALQSASQAQLAGTVLTSGQSSLGLQHQSSLRSTWSAQVTGGWMGFRADRELLGQAAALPSSQTRSVNARGGWEYRLTPATSVGLAASEGEIWFSPPAQHSRHANLQATVSSQWGGTRVHLGAGPAWNMMVASAAPVAALPPRSWSGEAGLDQQMGQTHMGLDWSHTVQASLTPGSVSTDNLALQLTQAWGRWNAGASLGSSRLAAATAGRRTLTGLYASTQIGYTLTQWSLTATCNYYSQDLATGFNRLAPLERLQASLGVSYHWQGVH